MSMLYVVYEKRGKLHHLLTQEDVQQRHRGSRAEEGKTVIKQQLVALEFEQII